MSNSNNDSVSANLPFAKARMILGFLSCILFGIFTAIPAIILGHSSLSKYRRNPNYKGKKVAIAGIILGYLGIVVTIAIFLRFLSIYYGFEK